MAAFSSAVAARIAVLGLLAAAGGAHAQNMSTNSASFNAGWGRTAGQENRPVDVATRDANGNQLIVDGIIQRGQDQSVFATAGAGGAVDTFAGVGSLGGASSAIGNNLVVITQGSHNTVIVNSQQTNTGNVSAGAALNGGVANVP